LQLDRRTVVDRDRPTQLQVIGHPLLPRRELRRESAIRAVPIFSPAASRIRTSVHGPTQSRSTRAASCRAFRRKDLGEHASAAYATARAARHALQVGVAGVASSMKRAAGSLRGSAA
jgi:hypothetical protein